MHHPLQELRKLLQPANSAISGPVVMLEGANLHVSTRSGIKIVPRNDITQYSVGDRVALRGGVLAGKLAEEARVPVFSI